MKILAQYFTYGYHYQRDWKVPVPWCFYWRLWWNDREAAAVVHTESGDIALSPDRFILVAPYTSFSVSLSRPTRHLDVHFLLAAPFDTAASGCYTVPADPQLVRDLKVACTMAEKDNRRTLILLFTRTIASLCLALPRGIWEDPTADRRFNPVLKAMDKHLRNPLSNKQLAELANMAPTSFIRRFRQLFRATPQAFYLRKRLEKACLLLETSKNTIDQIAEECGFCDRYYFSTIFRKHLGISPAAFRSSSALKRQLALTE